MTPATVDWTPALTVFAAAVVAALVLLRWLRTAAPQQADHPQSQTDPLDLEVERDRLLARLRELGPDAPTKERRQLELQAARVLMALDSRQPSRPTPPTLRGESAATPAPPSGSTLRGFVWGAASVAAVALLLLLVSQSREPRTVATDSQGRVGSTSDPETQTLRARIEKNPQDLAARLDLARHALAANDLMTVFNQTRFVLDRSPDEARALTYEAVVRLAMGQPKTAEEMLERALTTQPDLEDAYVYLMLVHTETGNAAAADAALQRAAARLPSETDALRSVLARMRSEARSDAVSPAEPPYNPHAALDRHGSTEPASVPNPSPNQSVSGTIALAATLRQAASSRAAVYVLVRPAGQLDGPPLAVRRLPATAFPLSFELDTADSMTGAPMRGNVRVEARLAVDGDATVRRHGEPRAVIDNVPLGSHNLRLTLTPAP
jgi:Tfp pilus assembly protein PilF